MALEIISQHQCFGGTLTYYKHPSTSTNTDMRFTLFMPPKPTGKALIYLSGLTCTEDNFTIKAGAYRVASELGLIIAAPDTSPRGDGIPDDDSISLGKGAGFYIDATEEPWSINYRMETYCAVEFPSLLQSTFPAVTRFGLFGHSMGGHGTLTLAQKYPDAFESLSVFAPVCTPSQTGWGQGAFRHYFGERPDIWAKHDATELMKQGKGNLPKILIDQGLADSAYKEGRLNPEAFVETCKQVGQPVEYRTHEGYDHGYFFIQTFIDDHLRHHAA